MKNKKLFMMFAAYAISASLANADQFQNKNVQRLYEKINKNIDIGKNNDDSYKLIEKILNKKIRN